MGLLGFGGPPWVPGLLASFEVFYATCRSRDMGVSQNWRPPQVPLQARYIAGVPTAPFVLKDPIRFWVQSEF